MMTRTLLARCAPLAIAASAALPFVPVAAQDTVTAEPVIVLPDSPPVTAPAPTLVSRTVRTGHYRAPAGRPGSACFGRPGSAEAPRPSRRHRAGCSACGTRGGRAASAGAVADRSHSPLVPK